MPDDMKCPYCGAMFTPRNRLSVTCQKDKCKRKRKAFTTKRRREERKAEGTYPHRKYKRKTGFKSYVCIVCGKVKEIPAGARGTFKFCGLDCSKKHERNRQRKVRERRRKPDYREPEEDCTDGRSHLRLVGQLFYSMYYEKSHGRDYTPPKKLLTGIRQAKEKEQL